MVHDRARLWLSVRRLSLVLCGIVTPLLFAATKPLLPAVPEHRISLIHLGYRPVSSEIIQREGYSMNTVDFIDDQHLLLTFNARKLIPRLPDDQPGDQDRLVRALVLHLPDGKLLHETEWRTHDRTQYLWPMGNGYFLLRLRNTLIRISPLRGKEGFDREPLLQSSRPIEVIQFSPSHDMLLVETGPEHHIGDDPTQPLEGPKIEATFYSLREGSVPTLHARAVAQEDKPFVTAFTSKGFLGTVKEDREHWAFDFHPFGGKPIELAGFTSTCQPHAMFVSDATFIATGCRGGDDRRLLGGFDLAAQANWVFTTDNAPVWPALYPSPGSGRFALRDTITSSGAQDTDHVSAQEITGQQIRVYTFHGGVELLRAPIGPVQRPAQNFTLSPDGRRLAVLHDGDIELYSLPPLSPADLKNEEREAAEVAKIAVDAERKIDTVPEKRTQP